MCGCEGEGCMSYLKKILLLLLLVTLSNTSSQRVQPQSLCLLWSSLYPLIVETHGRLRSSDRDDTHLQT